MILGIDPGPELCGVVLYDGATVLRAANKMPVALLLHAITKGVYGDLGLIACERVQSYGISGASLLVTAEVYGQLMQAAHHAEVPFVGIYRRSVLRALDVTGKGSRDALVRARLIEMHGGHKDAAVGRKASPGPLYGVSGHAWQALAVAAVAPDFWSPTPVDDAETMPTEGTRFPAGGDE